MKYTKKRKIKNKPRKTRKSYRGGESSYNQYKILYDTKVFTYKDRERAHDPPNRPNNYVKDILTKADPKQCIIMFPREYYAFTNYSFRPKPNKMYNTALGEQKSFEKDSDIDQIIESRIQYIISTRDGDTDTDTQLLSDSEKNDKVTKTLFLDNQIIFENDNQICNISTDMLYVKSHIFGKSFYRINPTIFIVKNPDTWSFCVKKTPLVIPPQSEDKAGHLYDGYPYLHFIYLQCSEAYINQLIEKTIESNRIKKMIQKHKKDMTNVSGLNTNMKEDTDFNNSPIPLRLKKSKSKKHKRSLIEPEPRRKPLPQIPEAEDESDLSQKKDLDSRILSPTRKKESPTRGDF